MTIRNPKLMQSKPMYLAIETATRALGVAVTDGMQTKASFELLGKYPHAVELPDAVNRVLREASTTLKKCEAILVDIGPGSFTGLRIGLAFAKALSFPLKKPLVGVSSLDVLAAGLPYVPQEVCVILDARQNNVYAARYRLQGDNPVRQTDYFLGPIDEALPLIPAESSILIGDGAGLYRERIQQERPKAFFSADTFWIPRAVTLARLGATRHAGGQKDDPATLVPMYLYPMDCSVRGPDRPTAVLPKTVHSVPVRS